MFAGQGASLKTSQVTGTGKVVSGMAKTPPPIRFFLNLTRAMGIRKIYFRILELIEFQEHHIGKFCYDSGYLSF